eukprot:TRINITY_DN2809_c0_g1_i1.p1 TRINITY_DN2809_c0_g1~~TRINITY_DN2809_c0_g1_i1.p1  ORF type:complete len:107 (-),score=12.84 TRINITY_DN2809_c0_g1_i1:278-598(-)
MGSAATKSIIQPNRSEPANQPAQFVASAQSVTEADEEKPVWHQSRMTHEEMAAEVTRLVSQHHRELASLEDALQQRREATRVRLEVLVARRLQRRIREKDRQKKGR